MKPTTATEKLMDVVQVRRHGASLVFTLTREIRDLLGIKENDRYQVLVDQERGRVSFEPLEE